MRQLFLRLEAKRGLQRRHAIEARERSRERSAVHLEQLRLSAVRPPSAAHERHRIDVRSARCGRRVADLPARGRFEVRIE